MVTLFCKEMLSRLRQLHGDILYNPNMCYQCLGYFLLAGWEVAAAGRVVSGHGCC